MYAIYGNIHHQYTVPQMLAYIAYMDPMGVEMLINDRYSKIVVDIGRTMTNEADKHSSWDITYLYIYII